MLPSKINQMKVSHETGSETNFGFGRALVPSYLGKPSVFGCSLLLLLLVNGGLQTIFRCIPPPTIQECVTSCYFNCAHILLIKKCK